MFTGIIEELGKVKKVVHRRGGKQFSVEAERVTEALRVGDSLSVNGTCLTVLKTNGGGFEVEAGEETLMRTTLKDLTPGAKVNLERSLRVGDPLGGHFVLGHVDGKGRIRGKKTLRNSTLMEIESPSRLIPYFVEKGSISVDGVSLTIVTIRKNRFSVSLLPYTLEKTTLGSRRVGDEVNLEVDMIAKHLHQIIKDRL